MIEFNEKYIDTVTDTETPIDKYGDAQYKIRCIETNTTEISNKFNTNKEKSTFIFEIWIIIENSVCIWYNTL